jgi:hypothetical protein
VSQRRVHYEPTDQPDARDWAMRAGPAQGYPEERQNFWDQPNRAGYDQQPQYGDRSARPARPGPGVPPGSDPRGGAGYGGPRPGDAALGGPQSGAPEFGGPEFGGPEFGGPRHGGGPRHAGAGHPGGGYGGPVRAGGGYGGPRHSGGPGQPGGGPGPGYGGRPDAAATTLLNGQPYDPFVPDGRPQGPGEWQGRRGPDGPGGPGGRGPDGPPGTGPRPRRRVRKHRMRRLWRFRTVKVITALLAAFLLLVSVSFGQALMANNGNSLAAKAAEWARDHYLGPVITFAEWLTYTPPKVGGKPSFSLATGDKNKIKLKKEHGFIPIIPKNLSSPAGKPLPGEGVWRLVETVNGQPAMFTTFLRPDSVHTSYVAGLVSMDQRLLKFSLHPGAEDPGPGNWNSNDWIPPGQRKGLMATFNGGFKLDVAGGGFYLNGQTRGTLTNGAASVVYYKDGTIKVGAWGQGLHMSPDVVGVRQNLKLIVDQGRIPTDVNQDVLSSWGATLGGAYYVWRSGIGITKDGRVIYVYGPALDVQTLAGLLQRAGAVEGMQLDINPEWTTFESYSAGHDPSNPTPNALLPTQQSSPYRYYSLWSRDFTAVYAR